MRHGGHGGQCAQGKQPAEYQAKAIHGLGSGLIAAAVKLLRLGQNASHTLLAEALASGEVYIAAASTRPLDDLGAFNPWWDIASSRHESADFRLFIS